METRDDISLMNRTFRIFTLVSLFGLVVITLHNLYINRFEDYFYLKFMIKCCMGVAMIAAFQGISHLRLRRVREALLHPFPNADMRRTAWNDLSRYPEFMFWLMLLLGSLYSPTYHFAMLATGGVTDAELQTSKGMYLVENLLFDLVLSLMLAALLYIVLRNVSRRYLAILQVHEYHPRKMDSIATPLFIQFGALFLLSMLALLWFVVNTVSSGRALVVRDLFLFAGIVFVISAGLFLVEVIHLRQSLQELIGQLRSLLGKKRPHLHSLMPIVTLDEIGQLADSFNRLQERKAREYQALEDDLRLAYNVQQQLLPESFVSTGPLQVAGRCAPTKDVGGDFYDVVPLPDGKLAVIVGDVTGKGLQAALIMSAVVVLLRTEIRRGGTPREIMNRMNQLVMDTIQPSKFVTIGLALFDPAGGKLEYSSAGHVSPYLLRDGSLISLETSSLPLGVDDSVVYPAYTHDLRMGDRFFFYTDGLVDARTENGSVWGFEGLEAELLSLDPSDHPETQVRALMQAVPEETDAAYADDKTVVLVRVDGACKDFVNPGR